MTGYDFFVPYRNYETSLLVKQSTYSKTADEESRFLTSIYKTLRDPDADLSIFSSFYDEADMIFVIATAVANPENRYQQFGFRRSMRSMYYPNIDISGYYGAPENTYCVINIVEDTRRFIIDMKGLVKLCSQENALIIPRKGWENDCPFLYYSGKNLDKYFKSNDIAGEIKNYLSGNVANSDGSNECTYADYIGKAEKTLFPNRSEKTAGEKCSWRIRFRKEVSDLFGLKDENYYKPGWEKVLPNMGYKMDRKNVQLLFFGT